MLSISMVPPCIYKIMVRHYNKTFGNAVCKNERGGRRMTLAWLFFGIVVLLLTKKSDLSGLIRVIVNGEQIGAYEDEEMC
jgi:hypothetical protein